MNAAGSVLLDTNVVVAHLRNDPDLTARLRATPAIYLTWVVLGELHYGALRAQRREAELAPPFRPTSGAVAGVSRSLALGSAW